jgi:hypothetical protein
MPLLAGWLTSLFAGLASYLAGFMTMRAAMIAAGIASFSALLAACYAAMAALVGGLNTTFPLAGGLLSTGIWMFVPDIAPVCLSIYIAADTVLALFFWQQVHLQMAMRGAS